MRISKILAGATLMLASVTASASIIEVIDDFSTDQGPLAASLGSSNFSSVAGSGILGGERDLMLEVFVDDFNQGASVNVAGGNFFLSSGTGVESQFSLTWDGLDGSSVVNTMGLGGINFGASAVSFITNIVESDLNAFFDVTFWSGDQGTAETVELPIPGVSFPGRDASFSTSLFSNTDFTNIGAIQVRGNILSPIDNLRQRSYDLQLGSVTAVPCLLYTSPSPRDRTRSRMPSSA